MLRFHPITCLLGLALAFSQSSALADDAWWSLRPLVVAENSPRSVDGFLQAALAKHGLRPLPRADRRTLIRRAAMDITGLLPSPQEVRDFESDPAADAWPRLIERLLASPHHGEQWARHWLDVARYSDTKGYVYAREEKSWVHASAYRDWVARALNEDMPYDRFVALQIAADQLVPPGSPDLAAMGFLTLGRRFLGVTHDIIDDRIDVVMRGTQGLTVACARCHDHKFDPVPTRDYYALYGVFQSSAEALAPCAPGSDPALDALKKRNRELITKRREEQMARTRATVREHLEAQLELEKYPEEVFGQILDEKDINPFIVRRWQAYLDARRAARDPVFAPWHEFARSAAGAFPATWQRLRDAPPGEAHPAIMAAFARPPADMREVASVYAKALAGGDLRHVLDGIGSPCHVPDEPIANIEMYFPTNVTVELWRAQGDVDRHIIRSAGAPAHAMILVDRPLPSTPRVFLRGNPVTKGDAVPRQFLSALGGRIFTAGSGRLELARAITDPRNPLTARVMVNRVWQHHFGRGIVTTASDFGKQGAVPSHPALLDWLAREFIESGWSVKSLHRRIMLSEAYQRQSLEGAPLAVSDDIRRARETDPDNRLLWRMNARRLGFEEARDAWLAAGAGLDLRIGGRPSALLSAGNTRRTLYALVDRESLPAVFRTFDFANPDLSIAHRTETIVPQQALFGMNHPFVVAQAKALLRSPGVRATDGPERVHRLYERLFQRAPSSAELAGALDYARGGDPPAAEQRSRRRDWQYGYGEWDEAAGRLKSFTPLPHFTGAEWQGGDDWPDARLGWLQLTATGGHPGNDRRHAVARRWTAPADGFFSVRSRLVHEPQAGDGVRAFVGHSRDGALHAVKALASKAEINLHSLQMRAGDTLDFVVDIGDGLNSDQFLWAPRIEREGQTGSGGDSGGEAWDAAADFSAQPASRLDAWEQLTQMLLLSNEFMFLD